MEVYLQNGGGGSTPKLMVCFMENLTKIDDLRVLLSLEPIWGAPHPAKASTEPWKMTLTSEG